MLGWAYARMGLFTLVRGRQILGSPFAGFWIRSRNTPPDSPGPVLSTPTVAGII
jgi:hypothetical protein